MHLQSWSSQKRSVCEKMNILYTINNSYVPQVAAAITSVCENNKGIDKIHFYIMSLQISKEEEKRLTEYVHVFSNQEHERTLEFIELEDIRKHFDFSFDITGWNPIVLARLLLDKLLPDNLHRIIYLDGDTIVRKSLLELWQTDMGNCSIGACMEPTCSLNRKADMGLSGFPYYNAGVLLIDLDNWKLNGTGKEIIDYYQAHDGKLFANDQDAINGSQKGKIHTLPFTYNYHNTYDIYNYRLLKKNCDYAIPSRKEVIDTKEDPCIIHFMGEDRPWREGNRHRFREDYFRYLDMTPWKGKGVETGWKLYFFCWDIFNFIMKPFPILRCHIINSLIPIVLNIRSKK